MKLIVGLGNPEVQYEFTRHNLGFLVVKEIAKKFEAKIKKSAVAMSMEAKADIDGQMCSLMLPLTYMNNSGVAVKQWIDKKNFDLKDVLIVYDDLALEFGHMRLKPTGSAGGHNGIKSIIDHLGTKDFARLRLGISKNHPAQDTADYVLSNFTSGEKKLLPEFINKAVSCVASWAADGTAATMNQFNNKG